VQVLDVCARRGEPEVQRLPRQIYLRASAFLQSAFYFRRAPEKSLPRG
jgi:hypothetical protein